MHNFFSSKEKELNLEHDASSISDLPPPYTSRKQDAASIVPSDIESPVPVLLPNPTKLLTIQAQGTDGCSLSFSGTELSIPIFLGTNTTAQPLYISNRASRRSNNAVLSHATDGDVLSTIYRWGYGSSREPKVYTVNSQFPANNESKPGHGTDAGLALTVKTSTWSKDVEITATAIPQQTLKWTYVKTATPNEGKLRVLGLFAEPTSSSSKAKESEPLAVLVRSKSTRTAGSSRWDGGNGGQLLIGRSASEHLDESLIVASCLMMLKKERDRQRNAQTVAVTS